MNSVVIPKNRFNGILKDILSKYTLAAPVRDGGNMVYKEIKDIDAIILDDEIAYKSPKEFLFPQVAAIMSFDAEGTVTGPEEAGKTVILGVKPCDLEALKILTAVFTKGKFVDTYFKQKLENTVIIGMGCRQYKPGCFCNERGIEKSRSSDCDIFLTEDETGYTAEILTAKGYELFKPYITGKAENPSDAGCGAFLGASSVISFSGPAAASSGTPDLSVEADDAALKEGILEINADENTLFNKVDWDILTQKCLGCGTCTYICPTCHCFEFKDAADKGVTRRYRYWDSCMYPRFTLHASGHNPRSSRKERYRQRIMHKYVYIRNNFGYIACTGCGRCIRSCPAGMNVRTVVNEINRQLQNKRAEV